MSKIIDKPLLKKFTEKAQCEYCRKPVGGMCHPHHLFTRGMGGARRMDIPINLIALCMWCHADFHNGNIERADLLLLVAKREKCQIDDIEREIYRLRRLP